MLLGFLVHKELGIETDTSCQKICRWECYGSFMQLSKLLFRPQRHKVGMKTYFQKDFNLFLSLEIGLFCWRCCLGLLCYRTSNNKVIDYYRVLKSQNA